MDRITELLKSVKLDYKLGIGKPEPLKGDMLGHWSRRIDKKNRLVYCVYEEEQIITVISLRGHYSENLKKTARRLPQGRRFFYPTTASLPEAVFCCYNFNLPIFHSSY